MNPFTLANDPLVNDPAMGVGGWFEKVGGVLRRGLGLLLLIFTVTHLVSAAPIGLFGAGGMLVFLRSGKQLEAAAGWVPLFLLLVVVAFAGQMLGYAAATYAATRQAAGHMVRLGEAMGQGLRRFAGLSGWTLLAGLLAAGAVLVIGLCRMNMFSVTGVLAALPVAGYALAATAMIGPAYLFERRSPITRSLHLLHGAFGRVLGRLLLVSLVLMAGAALDQILSLGAGRLQDTPVLGVDMVSITILVAVIHLPLTVLLFSGILATYAECRGTEGYTTSDLVREL